jgi:hypothetical protein
MQAQHRFLETGKPDILFYCHANPAEPQDQAAKLQRQKVSEFRKTYPGLFATFHTTQELKDLVKHHLVDLLLREPQRRYSRKRGWALRLAQRLDRLAMPAAYLDRSSAFVTRSLGKLGSLLDLSSLMSGLEYETLLAAQYVRALRFHRDDLSDVRQELRTVHSEAFEEAVTLTADLAAEDASRIGAAHVLDGVRCGFLSTLLHLGDALDLDQDAITTARSMLKPPADNGPLEHWLAYLTRSLRVSRSGLVTFHLGVPPEQKALASRLCSSVALIFEARWHQLRAVLSSQGVAIARAPMESAPSREIVAVPDTVLAELDHATRRARRAIRALQHFGDGPPCPTAIENLLPLPVSAIRQPVTFTFHPDLVHRLRLRKETEAGVREFDVDCPGQIVLRPESLAPPGDRYYWSLQRDDGDFVSCVGSGVVWQLGPADQARFAMGEPLPEQSCALLLRLGLYNDLLRELWPRLISGKATPGEYASAYDALLVSEQWLRTNAPESGQVELIRNVGNWLHQGILHQKGDWQ